MGKQLSGEKEASFFHSTYCCFLRTELSCEIINGVFNLFIVCISYLIILVSLYYTEREILVINFNVDVFLCLIIECLCTSNKIFFEISLIYITHFYSFRTKKKTRIKGLSLEEIIFVILTLIFILNKIK